MIDNKMQCVYVMRNKLVGITKIGISNNVEKRRSGIQTGSGCKITLIYSTIPLANAAEIEANLHLYFKKYRGIGEWFDVLPELVVNRIKQIENTFIMDSIYSDYINHLPIKTIAAKHKVSRQAIHTKVKQYSRSPQNTVITTETPKQINSKAPKKQTQIDIINYERIGKGQYKHKKTGTIQSITYADGVFIVV